MDDVAALILAAGLSSRMRCFKPLLDVGDRPMIERVIASFRSAGVEPLAVTGHEAARLEPRLEALGVRWVRNSSYRKEMLTSVQAGAAALDTATSAFFVQPGDVPFVSPGTLTLMVEAWRGGGADAVRPLFGGKAGHPVLMGRGCIPSILSFRGEGGLRALMREGGWNILDVETGDPGIVTDLDTPEEYERALRERGLPPRDAGEGRG